MNITLVDPSAIVHAFLNLAFHQVIEFNLKSNFSYQLRKSGILSFGWNTSNNCIGGTSWVTTAPAATTAPSPNFTPA